MYKKIFNLLNLLGINCRSNLRNLWIKINRSGKFAEYLVIIRYLFCGYSLVKHRWKVRSGEIDLIFQKGGSLVFCEVKCRSSDFELENCVTDKQKFRLKNSAELFISKCKQDDLKEVRFDLAIVKSIFHIDFYNDWLDS